MARPHLTEEDFLARVSATGYKLREGQAYKGVRERYSVVCSKHPENIWEPLGSNLINKKKPITCPLCSKEKQSKNNSFDHEKVVELFEKDGRGFRIRDGWRYKSNKHKISIVCPHHPDYQWVTRPLDVINEQKRCPICVGQARLTDEEIDKRLVGRKIKRITNFDGIKVWFRCEVDGHEWSAKPTKVTKGGSGCPMCSNKVPWKNDRVDSLLINTNPSIVRSSDVTIRGDKSYVGLRCSIDGYEWVSQISNLLKGYGCPCCRGNKYWNVELAKMWLQEHRPTISVLELNGVSKKSKFFCNEHNKEFERRFSDIRDGYGCDECSGGGGFKTALPGYLYYAKLFVLGRTFFKIGITNREPKVRITETKHNFELLHTFMLDGKAAKHIESVILYKFKHLIQQEYKFSGSTECFVEDIRKYVDLNDIVCYNNNPYPQDQDSK